MKEEFNLQPVLKNETVRLQPLRKEDFETLYQVASDPLIWEQHPNKNRYQREVFQTFFEGALQSKGAFLLFDNQSQQVIGSSRFYDWNPVDKTVFIGYTFFARDHWGGPYNRSTKTLMLNHAFRFANEVHFHIGAFNLRSQKAIEKLGAEKLGEVEMAYHGEETRLNFIYRIKKSNWQQETAYIKGM